jgi:hypothetical protein
MNRSLGVCLALFFLVGTASFLRANERVPVASQAQLALDKAAAEQKHTFLVFFKDTGPATQAMASAVKRGVDARAGKATFAYVNLTDPADRPLVDRFDVSRAPMPLTIAVAPNGAMTSLTPGSITDEQIEKAIVTPATAYLLKSMQEGKLVFVCLQTATAKPAIPAGVKAFCDDPEFKGRSNVMLVQAGDASEAEFIRKLDVAPPATVFLAPPAALVGKFAPSATKEALAAALHKAGHCCDDPNCKHNHGGQPASPAASGAARPNTPNSSRRN